MEFYFNWLVNDYLLDLLDSFFNPQKRVSFLYLVAAIIVAVFWNLLLSRSFKKRLLKNLILKIFSKEIWFSASTRADIGLLFINKFIMGIISPLLITRITATTFLFFFFHQTFESNLGSLAFLPNWIVTISYTIFLFLLDDFSRYWTHRGLHQIPLLWAFHKVHHSAIYLTPLTVLRTHPIEGVIFSLRSTLIQAISISLFVFLFGSKIDLISVYGVNIFLFIFNLMGSNLRHSHIFISYSKFFERLLISPAQHQIHHSNERMHQDKNFGVILALWDRLGDTLHYSDKNRGINFGCSRTSDIFCHDLVYIYIQPFRDAYREVTSMIKAILSRLIKRQTYGFFVQKTTKIISFSLILIVLIGAYSTFLEAAELNIYSHRQPFLINPFLKQFEKETGIKTNVVFSSKGLAQRLLAEGKRSPADVVLTVDISRLNVYADKDLLAPINSKILMANIPSHLRDSENRWFGLSKRARVIVASNDRVAFGKIKRIEDLADSFWKGRICSRPGSHVYNRALLASIIAANGEQAAENWARGLVSNLAQRPQGNDRTQIKAIFQGVCDLAIVNSYYFGKIRNAKIIEQQEWTRNTRIIFTNQSDRGNHINISGAGVAKYSKNKNEAIKFLEFLSGPDAQKLYTEINYEFPGNPKVPFSSEQKSWGSFSEDKLSIGVIAELAPKAQIIIDRVGW